MNAVQNYLCTNRRRLQLDRFGEPARWTCILKTPRFRASRHVVSLMLDRSSGELVLVCKVPRIATDRTSVEREAAVLAALHTRSAVSAGSVPRLIALEDYHGYAILTETAVSGQPMSPAAIVQDRSGCCQAVTDWLVHLQGPPASNAPAAPNRRQRLIHEPLDALERTLRLANGDAHLVDATRRVMESLPLDQLPPVIEHGDLSHPNLIRQGDGSAGVVDWELADTEGLPGCDLFFFLTYAAAAWSGAKTTADLVAAHRAAFLSADGWAGIHVGDYARRTSVPGEALYPLLVLTWVRSLARFLGRLSDANGQLRSPELTDDAPGAATRRFDAAPAEEEASPALVEWLSKHRYFALWRDSVDNRGTFSW